MGKLTIKTLIAAAAIGGLALVAQASEKTNVAVETFQVAELVPNTTLDKTEAVLGTQSSLERGNDVLRGALNTQ
ncbi:MAG: hypothetical protein O7B24_01615, partial [Alphaproteobacteria bacterium]|nr:hypothetical protein [Alphaproteobacteria bacterium]